MFAHEHQRVDRGIERERFELAFVFEAGIVHRIVDVRIVGAFTKRVEHALAGHEIDRVVSDRDGFEISPHRGLAEREFLH